MTGQGRRRSKKKKKECGSQTQRPEFYPQQPQKKWSAAVCNGKSGTGKEEAACRRGGQLGQPVTKLQVH